MEYSLRCCRNYTLLLLSITIFTIPKNSLSQSTLNDSLVAHYPFNGNANDISGNGNDGVVNGAILDTNHFGEANMAYKFDGINDYIEVADPVSGVLDFPTIEFAISLWIKSNNSGKVGSNTSGDYSLATDPTILLGVCGILR